jgi:hypothetical protein
LSPEQQITELLAEAEKNSSANECYEALYNYEEILKVDPENYQAWYGKGDMMIYTMKMEKLIKPDEVLLCFDKAENFCPEEERPALKKEISVSLSNLADESYKQLESWKNQNLRSEIAWNEFLERSKDVIAIIQKGIDYDASNTELYKNFCYILKSVLAGIRYEVAEEISTGHVIVTHENKIDDEYKKYLEEQLQIYTEYLNKKDKTFLESSDQNISENKIADQRKKIRNKYRKIWAVPAAIFILFIKLLFNSPELILVFSFVIFGFFWGIAEIMFRANDPFKNTNKN